MFSLILGALVTALGVLFLGANLGWWESVNLVNIWVLWPVLFILIGLRLIVRNALLFGIGALIILALALSMVFLAGENPLVSSQRYQDSWMWNWSNEPEKSYTETQSLSDAKQVELKLAGYYDVILVAGDDEKVTVNLTGPESAIERISLTQTSGVVTLSDTASQPRFFHWNQKKVTGTITVPKSLDQKINLSGLSQLTVRGTTAHASIDTSGASAITFENATIINPSFELSGAGKIKMDTCTGEAKVEISGAGEVTAATCTLDSLKIVSSGAGKVTIEKGSIQDLSVDASGASNIKIPKPTGTIEQDTSGAGSLKFH